ncbi:phosphate acetyltransferase [Gleimia hominis]|uniref:phosphate acetyltransferase n=1 Tax=Gleimia hominis TaxID=595468 RepID=UPI001E41EC8F|nr:phosphate acetyltransferase [Gleimia hominis]WIK64669.1 phosphate acetyltransferase [Gleimia hominis]
MTYSLYITATESGEGGLAIIRSVVNKLKDSYEKVGVFRAFVNGEGTLDPVVKEFDGGYGTARAHYADDELSAMQAVIRAYREFARHYDAVVIVGRIDGDPTNPGLLARSARTAANVGAAMAFIVDGQDRSADTLENYLELAREEVALANVPLVAAWLLGDPAELPQLEGVEILTSGDDDRVPDLLRHQLQTTTPLMFESALMERAQSQVRRIVLPESDDDRILHAAAIILKSHTANITFVGDQEKIHQRAEELQIDLSAAEVVDPTDATYLDRYIPEFVQLRKKKGMTPEQAREKLTDLSYFATMMVHMGDADGMVSGASHTTAETIVPSFQIIRPRPGTSIVSSVFLMLLKDRVHVYGDCAVNPNPTPEQLADIALTSAQTARQFGVEPRVALVSYSSGTSGAGPDVDAVAQATRIAQEKAPDLPIDGPIQFDAATDPIVAAKKMPGSAVAGRATVYIFPDLNTGNTTYKAVQRTSGATAVGPVLQGLNKPVNDLSRGALVADIVNTIAITAVQAQH